MLRKISTVQVELTPYIHQNKDDRLYAVASSINSSVDVNNFNIQKITQLSPDFTYVRFRAIGALEIDGPNANFDAFPYGEFEDKRPNYGYKSFVDKRAFIEHQSDNINNSIGNLVASYLNRFNTSKYGNVHWYSLDDTQRGDILVTRASTEDGSIEVLMAIDKELSPKVARMISTNSPVGCSMGTNIDYSECSVCGNRAHFEHQYCPHIQFSKGSKVFVSANQLTDLLKKGTLKPEWLPWVLSREEDRREVLSNGRRMVHANVFEVNYGLSFFELSVVANPAFHRGYKLQRVASSQRRGFRQLIPMARLDDNREIEVRFNVSEPFFDQAISSYATAMKRGFDTWSNQEKVEFLRDADVAKSALNAGAVEDILIAQTDVPFAKNAGLNVEPSNDPGFYTVSNPDALLNLKYANVMNPIYSAEIVEKEYNNYRFATETPSHLMYRNTNKDLFNYNDFTHLVSAGSHPQELVDELYRAASSNPNLHEKIDDYVSMLQTRFGDIARRDYITPQGGIMSKANNKNENTKKAVYDSLPSTVEDINNQGIEVEKTEVSEWKDGAKIGSDMIEDEKETRPMGVIFLDAISSKKALKDKRTTLAITKEEVLKVLTFVQKLKSKMAAGEDIKAEFSRPEPESDSEFGNYVTESLEHEEQEELTTDEAVEVLDNTIKDLEDVKNSLEGVEGDVEETDNDLDAIISNRKRWSKTAQTKISDNIQKIDPILEDAKNAVVFSKKALAKVIITLKNTTANSGGEQVDKNTAPDGKLALTSEHIKMFADIVRLAKGSNGKLAMEEDKEDKEDKKDEKEDDENKEKKEAAMGDYPKEVTKDKSEGRYDRFSRPSDDKKETKAPKADAPKEATVEKSTKTAETKEATAQPPTGARDLGDYGDPGGIEKIELETWWNGMYPQYVQMKNKERSTDFDSPDGRVDLLTGIVAGRIRNPLMAAKSKYAVIKVAEDGSPSEGFVVSFEDAAGPAQSEDTYNEFMSDGFFDQVVNTVASKGVNAALASFDGYGTVLTQAQMEGLTPGKTEKVNPLYDTYEDKKNSNTGRDSERLDDVKGSGESEKGYYSKAYNDPGYASEMVKKYQKVAEIATLRAEAAEKECDLLKQKETVRLLAKRAMELARVAASKGVIPFDKASLYRQAREYLKLDNEAFKQINAHLNVLPTKNARAITSYQIPEAENMQNGVAHQNLNAVHTIREEDGSAEALNIDGMQNSVKDNAKISSDAIDKDRIRKKASEIVPQITADNSGENVLNISGRFTSIGNDLRRRGIFEQYAPLLNRRNRK